VLRAVEFASRLGFAITPDAYRAFPRHRKEITKSLPRVTEESRRCCGGHALPTFLLLREVGLLDALLPAGVLREVGPSTARRGLFWALLDALDRAPPRPAFDDAVLFSLVLPVVRATVGGGRARGASPERSPH
jgi:poly(A) polymerase